MLRLGGITAQWHRFHEGHVCWWAIVPVISRVPTFPACGRQEVTQTFLVRTTSATCLPCLASLKPNTLERKQLLQGPMVFSGPCGFLEALREAAWVGRQQNWVGKQLGPAGGIRAFFNLCCTVVVKCQLVEVLRMFVHMYNPNCTPKNSLEDGGWTFQNNPNGSCVFSLQHRGLNSCHLLLLCQNISSIIFISYQNPMKSESLLKSHPWCMRNYQSSI